MREFNEPTVHDALRATFGALWLDANSEVIMQRSVAFLPALRERYAFGRIFGHKRLQAASRPRRWLHVAVGPALPALLLARLTSKALRSRCLLRRFTLAAGPLVAMVLSWSWGEWIGYVSGRPPRTLILAADVKPAEDRDENTASI
jgi:hypothetical protein